MELPFKEGPARVERLVLHKRPDANLASVHVQPPPLPGGVTVERFSTAHGKLFERHTESDGTETWFKVERA